MTEDNKIVKHCKLCLMTNQKPFSINETKNQSTNQKKTTLSFDENGNCIACQNKIFKKGINWKERDKELRDVCDKYRSNDKNYDCIVSGSGGKDSMFQAHILKYKYKMNPLTITYSPILKTNIGVENLTNWINVGGFDNYTFSANGKVLSILTRESFKNLLHPSQPFKIGIKTFAAKMAKKFDINLVFYGEEYSDYGSAKMLPDAHYPVEWLINDEDVNNIYIGGSQVKEIKKKYNFLTDQDFIPYKPLISKDLVNFDLNVLFLGYFLKWDPQEVYYYASNNSGFVPDDYKSDGSYGRYSSIDDKMEYLHFYCHYIKFGIGRCRLDASQEIRNGHITREEGVNLCKKYEGEFPKRYANDCFKFMGYTHDEAMKIIDKFRPEHLWKKKNNKWIRKQEIF
jgi:N-acetyl sugar amidotransferase